MARPGKCKTATPGSSALQHHPPMHTERKSYARGRESREKRSLQASLPYTTPSMYTAIGVAADAAHPALFSVKQP